MYFECSAHVYVRFKLAAGIDESWTRDKGVSQGCLWTRMFAVAFYPSMVPLFADALRGYGASPW